MKIEYVNSRKDYLRFNKYTILKQIKLKAALHLLFAFFLTGVCAGNSWNWLKIVEIFVPVAVVYFAVIYFVPLWTCWRRLYKASKDKPTAFSKTSMTVTEEGLLIESSAESTLWRWETLKMAEATPDFICVYLADKRCMLFPKDSFNASSDAIAFLGMVQSKTNPLNQARIQTLKAQNRPPYALGFICILPLIGAVLGIALIVLGISKYKDKWLIMIGLAGIIWTTGIYGYMQYDLIHSDFSKKATHTFAQNDLNALLKDIEFYKLEHGSYPDSLTQAVEDDRMTETVDPTQSFFSDKGVYFIYEKRGRHYYLFSSGADGIPGTKDDIYPRIAPSDSAKFGWISGGR